MLHKKFNQLWQRHPTNATIKRFQFRKSNSSNHFWQKGWCQTSRRKYRVCQLATPDSSERGGFRRVWIGGSDGGLVCESPSVVLACSFWQMLPSLSRDDELFKHTSKLTMASLLSKMLLLDCMGKGDGVNDAPSGPVFQNNKVIKFLKIHPISLINLQ
jgi:hypothetical protein